MVLEDSRDKGQGGDVSIVYCTYCHKHLGYYIEIGETDKTYRILHACYDCRNKFDKEWENNG
jgi:uncharacterized protein YmfQ (DUF2313 family)